MSSLKIKSTSPFKTRFFTPEPYQDNGIVRLISDEEVNAGILWRPGTGKTATLLHAIKHLIEAEEIDSALIVSKKRIVENTWIDEIAKWHLPFTVSSILGNPKQRLAAMQEEAHIYLTNYENIPWLVDQWQVNNFGAVMLVCDESTKLKNTTTKRFKAIRKILPLFSRRVIMSGTPNPRTMEDLFGQAYILDLGDSLGRYITRFRNEHFYRTGYMGYKWELRSGQEEVIYDKLAHLMHRPTIANDLPPLSFKDRFVKLPTDAWKLYCTHEAVLVSETKAGTLTSMNQASARSKLRQIAGGQVYRHELDDILDSGGTAEKEVVHVHDAKVDELMTLLEEHQGMPCLVAYEFQHEKDAMINAILNTENDVKGLLPKYKGKPFVPYIGSGVSSKDINQYIKWWNAGSLPLLLAHPDSAAHGLNMQDIEASVIYFSMGDNYENYEQFYQRVYRKGQKQPVIVFRIVARNTVDEDMLTSLGLKEGNVKAFLEAMEARTAALYG